MPVYRITDPSTGRKVKLTGDSPPTEAELNEIFAGLGDDVAPVAAVESVSPGIEEPQAVEQDQPEEAGFFSGVKAAFTGSEKTTPEIEAVDEIGSAPELNELSVSALRTSIGLLTTGDTEKLKGVISAQIPEAEFREDAKGNVIADLPSGSYALNKPGLTGQDLARGVFQALSFTPGGKVAAGAKTVAGRTAAAGVGSGATEAGLQAITSGLGGGEVDATDIALAGALGSGGQVAGDIISAAGRGITGKVSEQARRVLEAGKAADVPVLTTDVIPPKGIVGALSRQLGERLPLFGTSGKRAVQQEARERAVSDIAANTPVSTSSEIIESLKSQTSKVKKAAGIRLEAVKNTLDEVGEVPVGNLNEAISGSLARLKSVKIKPDSKTIAEIEDIASGAAQPHSFSQLRDARTAIREIKDAVDVTGKSQLPSKSKAALSSIEKSITKDLDAFVESSLGARDLSRYKAADRVWAQEASKLTKTRLKTVLDKGDLTPETVENILFSRKASEVALLHKSLNSEGKAAARSSLIQRALEKSTKGDEISPVLFANELERLKTSTSVFFKGDDLKAVNGLKSLLQATKRAQEASVVTPTGQSLFGLAAIGAGSQIGLVPSIAVTATGGAAARLYESPVVRNFLLRLNNTPKNSKAFDRLISTTVPKINALLQTARKEGSAEQQ